MIGYDKSFSSSSGRAFFTNGDDIFLYILFNHNSSAIAYAQTLTTSSPPSTNTGLPTIQIVSPHDGQLVPLQYKDSLQTT